MNHIRKLLERRYYAPDDPPGAATVPDDTLENELDALLRSTGLLDDGATQPEPDPDETQTAEPPLTRDDIASIVESAVANAIPAREEPPPADPPPTQLAVPPEMLARQAIALQDRIVSEAMETWRSRFPGGVIPEKMLADYRNKLTEFYPTLDSLRGSQVVSAQLGTTPSQALLDSMMGSYFRENGMPILAGAAALGTEPVHTEPRANPLGALSADDRAAINQINQINSSLDPAYTLTKEDFEACYRDRATRRQMYGARSNG